MRATRLPSWLLDVCLALLLLLAPTRAMLSTTITNITAGLPDEGMSPPQNTQWVDQGYLLQHHQGPAGNVSLAADPFLHPRQEKILPIFTVVRFLNGPCSVGSTSGTCYTAAECRAVRGTQLGSCARGFGVCCYKEVTCGGSTSTNCTYLVSPDYPGTYNQAATCSMTVVRMPDTCQLRLDFVEFYSFPPDQLGLCTEDQFTVPGEKKFTFLCGAAPSQWHFYLDVTGQADPTVFNFATSSANFNRKFKIKVSMIPCAQRVPCGCGQYFTGNTGVIQSFNYGGFYLAGLDYGICFRKEKNKCTTTLNLAGPSFIRCPTDLYRLPVGELGNFGNIGLLGVEALYCQLDTNVASLISYATILPSLTTVTNGPLVIWHKTSLTDGFPNYHSTSGCTTCAGFYQTFSHNDC
ncbi:uncharacterized protein [Procambarus clarkii]|uniref:uncharacterized protein isoform X1 n=1 Tax=Procambarus clarkii TaxID=6728 RepID=UPI001E675ED1|nr:uncharacterized protein LOC123756778 [Procambarus clarkii]